MSPKLDTYTRLFYLRYASDSDGPLNFVTGVNYFQEDRVYNTDQLVRVFPGIVGGNFTSGDNAFNIFLRDFAGLPLAVRENLIGAGLGVEGESLESGGPLPLVTDGNEFSGQSGASFLADTNNDQDLSSLAWFIEADYDVSDQFNVWASLRYTRDEKDIDFEQLVTGCDFACHAFLRNVLGLNDVRLPDGSVDTSTSQLLGAFQDQLTFDQWTPPIGMTYRPSEELTIYAKAVTGFKAGGFNENASSVNLLPLSEEESLGYEVGTNLRFDRSTVRIAAFYHERTDTVIAVDDSGFPPGTNLIGASLGYLDAEFESFTAFRNGSAVDLSGNKVPLIYDITASLQGSYRHDLGESGLNMFYYGLYTAKNNGFLDEDNLAEADDISRLNLKLGLESENWRLIGYVDNVTDEVDIAYQNPRDQF